MIHYKLPSEGIPAEMRLPFFLAMEEWVALRMSQGEHPGVDAFFTWQVDPTVIFGRNQRIDKEVDIDYCQRNGIEMYRRRSGGGCVFADRSNIMISYITVSRDNISTIFHRYATTVAGSLRDMGIRAEVSGRNDITIDGCKVSGNAFYHTPSGVSIVHGTMLYDTDMSHMASAITPSKSKLESKGVKSVESRITMLRRHTSMSLADFLTRLQSSLETADYTLTPADIAAVKEIERPYYRKGWIMGRHSSEKVVSSRHIPGVGEIEARVSIDDDGRIAHANLAGDFFPLSDIDSSILDLLRGVSYTPEAVAEALRGVDVPSAIANLDNHELVNLLFQ